MAEPKPRKTKTQSQTQKPGFDPFNTAPNQPPAPPPQDQKQSTAGPELRKASAAKTRTATSNINPTDQMRDMLGRMRDIDIDPNLEPYPDDEPEMLPSTKVNTKNLPAVAGKAMLAAGFTDPEFHQVARLPGNMAAMIRQLGKSLFGSITRTPTKDIYVVANLMGQGPNTTQEVNAVANYAKRFGQDMGPGDIDFDRVMPGYSAETHQYSAGGVRWLLVKDFGGTYIYAWPEQDSKDATNTRALPHNPPLLR